MKHLLITGKPGVGKTTLIRDIAQRLRNYGPIGFYTEEIRADGHREGFRIVSFDGRSGILSHVKQPGPYRLGRYGVDLTRFERFLTELDLAHSPSKLLILDEIGKMECHSSQFMKELETLLNSSKLIIATIALKGEGFIKRVRERPDCRLFSVTLENRDGIIDNLIAEILEQLGMPTQQS